MTLELGGAFVLLHPLFLACVCVYKQFEITQDLSEIRIDRLFGWVKAN